MVNNVAENDKTRRCLYSDGDVEDLSLKDLRTIVELNNEQKFKNDDSLHDYKENELKQKQQKQQHYYQQEVSYQCQYQQSKKRNVISNNTISKLDITTEIEYNDSPIDDDNDNNDDDDNANYYDDDDNNIIYEIEDNNDIINGGEEESIEDEYDEQEVIWLENVATSLAKGGKSTDRSNSRRSSISSHKRTSASSNNNNNNNILPLTSSSVSIQQKQPQIITTTSLPNTNNTIKQVITLASLKAGTRFGKKVKHMPSCTNEIGEVLLDEKGWVEAIFDKDIIKDRAKNFLLINNDNDNADDDHNNNSIANDDKNVDIMMNISNYAAAAASAADISSSSHHTSSYKINRDIKRPPPPSSMTNKSPSRRKMHYEEAYANAAIKKSYNYSHNMKKENKMTTTIPCTPPPKLKQSKKKCNNNDTCIILPDKKNSPTKTKSDEVLSPTSLSSSSSSSSSCISNSPQQLSSKQQYLQTNNKPKKEKYKLSNFFYWNCHYCTSFNSFLKVNCEVCQQPKTYYNGGKGGSILSPLLEKVNDVVLKYATPNDAYNSFSPTLRRSIDKKLIQYFYGVRNAGLKTSIEQTSFVSIPVIEDKPIKCLDDYFNWSCSFCSFVNTYKVKRCKACLTWSYLSEYSIMLQLALDTSKKHDNVKQALDSTPFYHKPAMPKEILEYLITCSYVVMNRNGTGMRRCMKPKVSGKQHCILHLDPFELSDDNNDDNDNSDENDDNKVSSPHSSASSFDKLKDDKSSSSFTSKPHNRITTSTIDDDDDQNNTMTTTVPLNSKISTLISSIHTFFNKKCNTIHVNPKQYCIQSIEDAITLQQEMNTKSSSPNQQQPIIKSPFPLGMKVRRFFTKFGFHDGRIIQINKNIIFDDKTLMINRPVLLYRVKYLDGDEEDFLNYQIISLKQFYNIRNVNSTDLPICQIIPKTIYLCSFKNDKNNSINTNAPTATTATSNIAITKTSSKDWIQIISNHTPMGIPNKKEGGIVKVTTYKQHTSFAKKVNLNVTDLQTSIIKKYPIDALDNYDFNKDDPTRIIQKLQDNFNENHCIIQSPIFEWPKTKLIDQQQQEQQQQQQEQHNKCDCSASTNTSTTTTANNTKKDKTMIFDGLWLTNAKTSLATQQQQLKVPFSSLNNDYFNNSNDIRPGVATQQQQQQQPIWDPSYTSSYLLWDPYSNIVCEICKSGSDEHQMLLCDKCEKGYHMYCLRPIVVNIPTHEWICKECSSNDSKGNPKQNFEDLITKLTQRTIQQEQQQQDVNDDDSNNDFTTMKFLNLHNYRKPSDFRWYHEEELSLFDPENAIKRKTILQKKVTKSRTTTKYQSLYVSYGYSPSSNEWVLPVPLPDVDLYTTSIISIVAAMKFCGMKRYSEELVYAKQEFETMNDCTLDNVQPMNKRNLEIFREFKYNLSRGAFPPIKIVYDEKVGFTVEALAKMPRHTLVAEYIGEVTTVERSEIDSGSDSLMMLLDTGNPKTSLIIDPSNIGNIARFLSGVNNRCFSSKRKANVRTRRFELDGKSRVVLFTSKTVDIGDKLHYDYNSGLQDKEVEDWAKNGFYDTSNFI